MIRYASVSILALSAGVVVVGLINWLSGGLAPADDVGSLVAVLIWAASITAPGLLAVALARALLVRHRGATAWRPSLDAVMIVVGLAFLVVVPVQVSWNTSECARHVAVAPAVAALYLHIAEPRHTDLPYSQAEKYC